MFNRVEKQEKKLIKKATLITREQNRKLIKVLEEINLPYTTFFHSEGLRDDAIICLSNDVFIVEDYFKDFRLPSEFFEETY